MKGQQSNARQCAGNTKRGERCQNRTTNPNGLCGSCKGLTPYEAYKEPTRVTTRALDPFLGERPIESDFPSREEYLMYLVEDEIRGDLKTRNIIDDDAQHNLEDRIQKLSEHLQKEGLTLSEHDEEVIEIAAYEFAETLDWHTEWLYDQLESENNRPRGRPYDSFDPGAWGDEYKREAIKALERTSIREKVAKQVIPQSDDAELEPGE